MPSTAASTVAQASGARNWFRRAIERPVVLIPQVSCRFPYGCIGTAVRFDILPQTADDFPVSAAPEHGTPGAGSCAIGHPRYQDSIRIAPVNGLVTVPMKSLWQSSHL